MSNLSLDNVNFHDAFLVGLEYDWAQQTVSASVTSFLQKDENAVPIHLEFRCVTLFICTNLQPWGPSQFINLAASDASLPFSSCSPSSGDKILHIQMQSGDDIFVGYKTVIVNQMRPG